MRSIIFPPIAKTVYQQYQRESTELINEQRKLFYQLFHKIQTTAIGNDLSLHKLTTYDDYRRNIPIQHYTNLEPYILRASRGEKHMLWPGIPKAIAVTAGTTSGQKFIPLTAESYKSHRKGRMIAIANYSVKYNEWDHLKGPLLYFTGNSTPRKLGKYDANLVSSLLFNNVPNWYRRLNLPSEKVTQTIDFSERMMLMIDEALKNRNQLRGIVAFPPWLSHFLDQLEQQTNSTFGELFPNFNLLVTSGMSFTSYETKIMKQLGQNFDRLETYPTSEGFIGFTASRNEAGFSLLPQNGIFYEFVKVVDMKHEHPQRFWIDEVELGVEYALILTTNAGLLSYVLGDTVKFININPHTLIITGRVNRAISILKENVTVTNTNNSISKLDRQFNLTISEYCVTGSPQQLNKKPQYTWIIACKNRPEHPESVKHQLHLNLIQENILYGSFSEDGLFDFPEVLFVKEDAFLNYLKTQDGVHFQQKIEHIQLDLTKFNLCYEFMLKQQHVTF